MHTISNSVILSLSKDQFGLPGGALSGTDPSALLRMTVRKIIEV